MPLRKGRSRSSGFSTQGKAETLTQGVPTTGRIPNGALVEREAPGRLSDEKVLVLELRNPDFNTAVSVADAINAYSARPLRPAGGARRGPAHASSCRGRARSVPHASSPRSASCWREPDVPARVVIDERTGTIVIGKDVQISTVAVAHGNLTVRVTENTKRVPAGAVLRRARRWSRPKPSSPRDQKDGKLAIVARHRRCRRFVGGLNKIGLKPQGIIAILQAIKSAGALQADLVVQ